MLPLTRVRRLSISLATKHRHSGVVLALAQDTEPQLTLLPDVAQHVDACYGQQPEDCSWIEKATREHAPWTKGLHSLSGLAKREERFTATMFLTMWLLPLALVVLKVLQIAARRRRRSATQRGSSHRADPGSWRAASAFRA